MHNLAGVFQITPKTTYLLSDIDECAREEDNCDDNAACTDTDGSFNCTCSNGYEGSGVNCSSKQAYYT